MTLKYALLTGAAMLLAPATGGNALAAEDDSYVCNGQLCYDDQAGATRDLNNQALEQAQEENDDDGYAGMPSRSYGGDDYDDGASYSYGDRSDAYGDDDDDDADTNPYDDDSGDD